MEEITAFLRCKYKRYEISLWIDVLTSNQAQGTLKSKPF